MTVPSASSSSAFYGGDCLEVLPTLPADAVQLIVTSPPYNVGWDYGDAGAGDRRPLAAYREFLAEALAGCCRVLRPGGVLALNLPPTIRSPDHRAYPLSAWVQMRLLDQGWLLREPLVWAKMREGTPIAATTAVGRWTNPYLRPTHELVMLASKEDYRLSGQTAWPEADGHYMEWLKDVWPLPPGRGKRGEALAFPDELVRRLVELFSAPGDVVLDPFAGTGTTGRVALALGRQAWLIEKAPAYWTILERIVRAASESAA